MAHDNSSSGPISIQGGLHDKAASKKPSTYIFDSNGDTQLILSTYNGQTFTLAGERIWIGQEKSRKIFSKKEKKKNKKKKKAASIKTPAPLLPEEPPEEPSEEPPEADSTIPMSPRENPDSFSSFSKMVHSFPEFSEEGILELAASDDEKDIDNSSLQEWDYGERLGNLPNKVEIRMLVSGKHLMLASSYFEKMFSGPFAEGNADDSGIRRVTASDWDPEAFNIMLTIIHGYYRDVPKSISLEMLAKLAMIVDYYECHETIELYANIWLEGLKPEVPKVYGRDCILYMLVSWVFSKTELFEKMTRLALRNSGKLIESENIPIPCNLLGMFGRQPQHTASLTPDVGQIDIARLDYLDKMFSATYDLLDRLQEEPECSYECSSMLLGVLTKELKKHGILSPRCAQPFYGLSIEGSKDMIASFTEPRWYDEGNGLYRGYGNRHSCTIQQKLHSALEKAENELRVFTLQDFELGKTAMRPPKNVGPFAFECK